MLQRGHNYTQKLEHHMERIKRSKDELLDGAFNWILRTPESVGLPTGMSRNPIIRHGTKLT